MLSTDTIPFGCGQFQYYSPKLDLENNPPSIIRSSLSKVDKYLEHLYKLFGAKRLNYFERNLEVWRQLWRVAERSDILVIVVDARFPLFHFPDAIYNWVRNELNKPVLLVLNKVKFKIHERKRVNF